EGVLLGFVEAMDFVDEDNCASAILTRSFGLRHHLLDLFDPREHGAELDELGASHAGNDFRECSLTGAGRAPEDKRAEVVTFNLGAQRFTGANEVLLADIFVERARAHAVGKGTALVAWVVAAGTGLK